MFNSRISVIGGVRLVEDINLMVEKVVIDPVRPKGRGFVHFKRVKRMVPSDAYYLVGDVVYAHPELMDRLRREIAQAMERKIDQMALNALTGRY